MFSNVVSVEINIVINHIERFVSFIFLLTCRECQKVQDEIGSNVLISCRKC